MAVTAYQERRIRELRQRGAGYRTIAAELGISRDTVRNFCTSHALSGVAADQSFGPANVCPLLWWSNRPAASRPPPPLLLRCMLPEMVGSAPGRDSSRPGGAAPSEMPVLWEGIHCVRQRPAALLLSQLLYSRPLLAGGRGPGTLCAFAVHPITL